MIEIKKTDRTDINELVYIENNLISGSCEFTDDGIINKVKCINISMENISAEIIFDALIRAAVNIMDKRGIKTIVLSPDTGITENQAVKLGFSKKTRLASVEKFFDNSCGCDKF